MTLYYAMFQRREPKESRYIRLEADDIAHAAERLGVICGVPGGQLDHKRGAIVGPGELWVIYVTDEEHTPQTYINWRKWENYAIRRKAPELTLSAPEEGRKPPRKKFVIAEKWYKDLLCEILERAGWYHVQLAAGGLGARSGLPDRLAICPRDGVAWGFEVKGARWVRGKWEPQRLRANQAATCRRFLAANAQWVTFCSDTVTSVVQDFQQAAFIDENVARIFLRRIDAKHVSPHDAHEAKG